MTLHLSEPDMVERDGTYRAIYDRYFTEAPLPELIKIWPGLA